MVEMTVSLANVHSAAGADLIDSKSLCQGFILYQSTIVRHYVPWFVSLIMLCFNILFQ
jgi:hypothetical protein